MKHYIMTDQHSGQKKRRAIHLIQIELPRAVEIKNLSPTEEHFLDRSKDFTAIEWWCCVLKYANQFKIGDFEEKEGQFSCMPEAIYHAFEMLRRENWGDDLMGNYEREKQDMGTYGTMMAANQQQGFQRGLQQGRVEGLQEGQEQGRVEGTIRGLIERFAYDEDLGRPLQRIAKNSLSEEVIRAIWSEYAYEMHGDKDLEDFMGLLRDGGVLE
jgi:hypothetical protein